MNERLLSDCIGDFYAKTNKGNPTSSKPTSKLVKHDLLLDWKSRAKASEDLWFEAGSLLTEILEKGVNDARKRKIRRLISK
jgi:hypothetical protein